MPLNIFNICFIIRCCSFNGGRGTNILANLLLFRIGSVVADASLYIEDIKKLLNIKK